MTRPGDFAQRPSDPIGPAGQPSPAGPSPAPAAPAVPPAGAPAEPPVVAPPQPWAQAQPPWGAQPAPWAAQPGPAMPTQGQAWASQPAWGASAQPLGQTVMTHLKRSIEGNLADIEVTPRERAQLEAARLHPRLHGLFAWRRSSLLAASPILVLSTILSFVNAARVDTSGYNAFGVLWNYLPSIGLLFIPIGALGVVALWTEARRSSRFLIVCWSLSLAFPLGAALVPLDLVMDLDGLRAQAADVLAFDQAVLTSRILQALAFMLILLPVVLSVPGGLMRGASRVKSLFPSSSLPGWFLLLVAPFYSLFTVTAFVVIDQLAGNALLLIGVGILAFMPWLFVIYRQVYMRPLSSAEARVELLRAGRMGRWLALTAASLITVYVLTGTVGGFHVVGSGDDAIFSYIDVLRTAGEVISRALVTTVVFATILLSMVHAEWRTMAMLPEELRREHDEQMAMLGLHLGVAPAVAPDARDETMGS